MKTTPNANANLTAWVWTKDTIVRRTAAPCVNVGLFPSRLIAKIMLRFLVAVLPKIGITGGIVANAGKWACPAKVLSPSRCKSDRGQETQAS